MSKEEQLTARLHWAVDGITIASGIVVGCLGFIAEQRLHWSLPLVAVVAVFAYGGVVLIIRKVRAAL